MGFEIEKKFLVINNSWRSNANGPISIKQGYITTKNNTTVRIRIINNKEAFLTLKDIGDKFIRNEFEYSIPLKDGQEIFNNLCDSFIIKDRYTIPIKNTNLKWEIDVYLDKNKPLVIAELEASNYIELENIKLPDWIGSDITYDSSYKNNNLSK
jgi:CYTH domain-containing protein